MIEQSDLGLPNSTWPPWTVLALSITAMVMTPSVFRRLLGHASTTYHHSPSGTIKLRFRSKPNSSDDTSMSNGGPNSQPHESTQLIPFSTFVNQLLPPCNLSPLLFNGHLQTIWTAVKSKDDVPIYYKRRIFHSNDPDYEGNFAADFVVSREEWEAGQGEAGVMPLTRYFTESEWNSGIMCQGSQDTKPMLVVLHGLSGGSHETYLREVLYPLVTAGAKQNLASKYKSGGWEAVVVNSRGCAGSKITSDVLYNARATWDVRQVVKWLRQKFPNRPLFGVGFSLGANILTNYLGEEGESCPLKSAVIISNPFNLESSSIALQRSWIGLNIYSSAMGRNMVKLFEKHKDEILQNTRIDVEEVKRVKFLHEFDRAVQTKTWGYPTEGAYYRDASSIDSVMAIRIPFLAISALDDPIATHEGLPIEEIKQTPYGVLCATSLGGHLSWFELGGGRWFAKATSAYFQTLAAELDLNEPFEVPNASSSSSRPFGAKFEVMRRKLYRKSMAEKDDSGP